MPSPRRRTTRRDRSRRRPSIPKRLFDILTNRIFIGVVWLLAAVLAFVIVGLDPMNLAVGQEWSRPRVEPEMARGLAALLALGMVGLGGLGWKRWRKTVAPERIVDARPAEGGRQTRLGTLGMVLILAGGALIVGDWLSSHQKMPAGELVLPLGESAESVEVTHGDRSIEVMLPMRTTAHFLDLEGAEPQVWLQFSTPDRHIDRPDPETLPSLRPSESLDVDGKRFVFTGFSRAQQTRRAFLSSPADATRPDSGVVGDDIQLSVDGPTFRIVDITDDYLDVFAMMPGISDGQAQLMALAQGYPIGVLGPAVELETEDGQRFWVFERGGDLIDESPYVGESLQLDSIQKIPSPVVTVTSVEATWPFALGMLLFVLGWALLLVFPERVVEQREDGRFNLWSLNRIETPLGDSGSWKTTLSTVLGPIVALVGLALALGFGATEAGVLALAGVVAAAGLPGRIDHLAELRATSVAAMIPLAVVVGAIAAVGTPVWAPSLQTESLLWTAQIGSWLAMAVGLVGAGMLAEESLDDSSTNGVVTVALAVWAAMGAVVFAALERGRITGEGLAVPLVSDGESVAWNIPGLDAATGVEIPAVAPGLALGIIAAAVGLLAALGVVGAVLKRRAIAFAGWIGALFASVSGLLHLFGVGPFRASAKTLDEAVYQQVADRWLSSMDLPQWLGGMGGLDTEGEMAVDTASLVPEMMAFFLGAALSLAMVLVLLGRRRPKPSKQLGPLAGRDLFVRSLLFGAMGWVLGLVLGWERLGAFGIFGPMEWLGIGVLLLGGAVLMIGWRKGESAPESFIRAFGPGLVLSVLIWVIAFGAVGHTAPGASIPLF